MSEPYFYFASYVTSVDGKWVYGRCALSRAPQSMDDIENFERLIQRNNNWTTNRVVILSWQSFAPPSTEYEADRA